MTILINLPNIIELPKGNESKSSTCFLSTIDIFQTAYIDRVILVMKVFILSIIYHLVEEKTSKSISGFNYSWFITFFEFSCAFLFAFTKRISIEFNQVSSNTSSLGMTEEESQLLLNNDIKINTSPNLSVCNKLYISMTNIWLFSTGDLFCWSYLFLSLNLIICRGLGTIVLQYYDMDYPTYAICKNLKMFFLMFLSIVWLKKIYGYLDWMLVLLTWIAVLCFRLASHDVWFSSVNTMGVPLLLLSTFLSAMDGSWKEKVSAGIKGIMPSEIIFNTNLLGIIILFIYLTVFSNEFMEANIFLISNPLTIFWMIIRGISYALWIHFSVVLISKSGALINQYVSVSRKLFTVLLSFVIFKKPFYFIHGVGFMCFMIVCSLKIAMTINNKQTTDFDSGLGGDRKEHKVIDSDLEERNF